jgi:ubiquinone/menaquinone biosynthesis C-methylase UbiE
MEEQKILVEQFYNNIAFEYHDQKYISKNISSFGMLKRRCLTMQLLDSINTEGKKLLDVGCGAGSYTPEFIRRGYEVWGVDISSKMVEQAKKLLAENNLIESAHFSRGDIENLDFQANFFDVFIATGVLEYLGTDDKAIKEIFRVLKPNGVAILTLNNKWSYSSFIRTISLTPIKKIIAPLFPKRVSCAGFIHRRHAPKKFITNMNLSGFSFIKGQFCGFSLIPYNFRAPKAYLYFSKLLEKLLKSIGLSIIFGTYVGAFRKRGKD